MPSTCPKSNSSVAVVPKLDNLLSRIFRRNPASTISLFDSSCLPRVQFMNFRQRERQRKRNRRVSAIGAPICENRPDCSTERERKRRRSLGRTGRNNGKSILRAAPRLYFAAAERLVFPSRGESPASHAASSPVVHCVPCVLGKKKRTKDTRSEMRRGGGSERMRRYCRSASDIARRYTSPRWKTFGNVRGHITSHMADRCRALDRATRVHVGWKTMARPTAGSPWKPAAVITALQRGYKVIARGMEGQGNRARSNFRASCGFQRTPVPGGFYGDCISVRYFIRRGKRFLCWMYSRTDPKGAGQTRGSLRVVRERKDPRLLGENGASDAPANGVRFHLA